MPGRPQGQPQTWGCGDLGTRAHTHHAPQGRWEMRIWGKGESRGRKSDSDGGKRPRRTGLGWFAASAVRMERCPLAWGVKDSRVPTAAAPKVCISRLRNMSRISILKFSTFSFQLSLTASFSAGWAALDFGNEVFFFSPLRHLQTVTTSPPSNTKALLPSDSHSLRTLCSAAAA